MVSVMEQIKLVKWAEGAEKERGCSFYGVAKQVTEQRGGSHSYGYLREQCSGGGHQGKGPELGGRWLYPISKRVWGDEARQYHSGPVGTTRSSALIESKMVSHCRFVSPE